MVASVSESNQRESKPASGLILEQSLALFGATYEFIMKLFRQRAGNEIKLKLRLSFFCLERSGIETSIHNHHSPPNNKLSNILY